MYRSEFIKARNHEGKIYRDKNTGNLVTYCSHSYIVKPKFEYQSEVVANEFSYEVKRFTEFEGVCMYCGDIIFIRSEDVVDEQTFNKRIEEKVKEIEKKSRKKR